MYAFQLWREFKLSIAEIYSLFPTVPIIYTDKNILILDTQNREEILLRVRNIWGTIKVIELIPWYRGRPEDIILKIAEKHEGKFRYWLSSFGDDVGLKIRLMNIKRSLKNNSISGRFVNKDFKNLSSSQIIGENLVERESDFTLIVAGDTEYFGKTIWIQDIENYSKRDYGKTRDMQVGMLPPKLAQIMIHFSWEWNSKKNLSIYDPFCGLWTILIESILMWNSEVYGSDISPENVEKTKKNINYTRKEFENKLKTSIMQVLDARGISSSPFLKKADVIVTEWYLWEIFHKHSLNASKIEGEKQKLLDIYTSFFFGLQKSNFKGVIVISFPFWELRGKYIYFSEVYDLIKKYGKTLPLLPSLKDIKHTRSGSLLYKRLEQVVGREIFKIKMR